jgi:enoyl-CoA hydratase
VAGEPPFSIASPSPTVVVDILESAAVQVWLNRPDQLNALDVELADALLNVVQHATAAGATALLIRGRGRAFCAGADLKARQKMSPEQRYAHNRTLNGIVNAIAAVPVPTIAVINGGAFGGGLELALGCDIRIAAESASVGLTEARIGAIPGAGGTQRLPRLIGVSKALEMMYLGEPVTATKAQEIGLVNVCVPDDRLEAEALRFVGTLGQRSAATARLLKKVVYLGMAASLSDGLELERQALGAILGSDDYAEGVAAFAEKRPPRFRR